MSTESWINSGLRLTRLASTEEYVGLDAPHWAIEPYLPVNTSDLIESLLSRRDAPESADDAGVDKADGGDVFSPDAKDAQALHGVFSGFADLLHHQYRPLYTRFARRYAALDPDRDTRPPISEGTTPPTREQRLAAVAQITHAGRLVLEDAGYTEVSREELEAAVGMVSHWGVPLHVDFSVFDAIAVYSRGDVVGKRAKRLWRNFYREKLFDVALYQRVVVMFKLREGFRTEDDLDHTMLHLRMFKNIPKQDIDMLLPGTRIRFSWLDHMKNLVPSIGGIGVTLFKIARIGLFVAAITFSIAAVLAGLCLALIGYGIRSVMNHFHVRNRYMLNLTRNLYYQKLASNAGVSYRLLEEAESQRHREVVLAYYALLSAGEPISLRRLRRRAERMIREIVDVEVRFRAEDAVQALQRWNLLTRTLEGKYATFAPAEAQRRIQSHWENLLRSELAPSDSPSAMPATAAETPHR